MDVAFEHEFELLVVQLAMPSCRTRGLLTNSGRTSWTATAAPRSTARVDAVSSSPATAVRHSAAWRPAVGVGRSAPNLTTARRGRRRSRVTRL